MAEQPTKPARRRKKQPSADRFADSIHAWSEGEELAFDEAMRKWREEDAAKRAPSVPVPLPARLDNTD